MTDTTSEFPILDVPRDHANLDYNCAILDFYGHLEPYVSEMDSRVAMPVRLVHTAASRLRNRSLPLAMTLRPNRVTDE